MKHLPRFWTYLLFSEHGELYIGQTRNLRRRLREHNSPSNRGWTRGRRWRLLAVAAYLDLHSALRTECQLKRWYRGQGNHERTRWLRRARRRLKKLCLIYGIEKPLRW